MTTMKQRMLAFIRGEKTDRVPFAQYDGIGGGNEEIWQVLGRENMGLLRWCGAVRVDYPNIRYDNKEVTLDGRQCWRNVIITPVGELSQVIHPVPGIPGVWTAKEHYVKTLDDYAALAAYLRDAVVTEDASSVVKSYQDFGDCGLPHVHLGRTPWQSLWVQWVGIIDLSVHMSEDPTRVEECMDLIGRTLLRCAEVTLAAADKVEIPYVVVGDNITAPLIGEARFRKYAVPYYRKIAAMFAARDIPLAVHMDGDLKPLWTAIGESGVQLLDSFSPQPDNDTSVGQAVQLWPRMRLMVNFPSSIHLAKAQKVYATALEMLQQAGHTGRLQIQVSENPPAGAWKTSYPAIIKAIHDFAGR